jgi:hypothetical protein
LGEKLGYNHRHWDGLQILLTDGRVEMDTNLVENTIRPITLNVSGAPGPWFRLDVTSGMPSCN